MRPNYKPSVRHRELMSDEVIVAEIVEPSAAFDHVPPNEAKKTSKILLFLIPILLSLLGLAIGAAIGGAGYLTAQKGYESQIKVLLLTDSENGKQIPHQELIASRMMIESLLSKVRNLEKLKSFDDVPESEIAGFIQEHLDVELNAESSIMTVRMIASGKNDAAMLLNNLLYTYESYLDDERKREQSQVEDPNIGNRDHKPSDSMRLLQTATTGEYRIRYPISGIISKALIGLGIGFLIGAVMALILK